MPILHGCRERVPANLYDAFRPRDLRDHNHLRMFWDRYIGNSMFTNMQTSGCLPSDQTAAISNWYARTNLSNAPELAPDFQAAWNAWTHATIVTLVVGTMPVHQLPLSDLLGRKEGQVDHPPRGAELTQGIEALAQMLFCQFNAGDDDMHGWASDTTIPLGDRQKWIRTAELATEMLTAPLLTVIPRRQIFGVKINTNTQALGAMLETMPTNTAPEALVWVHLEGLLTHSFA